VRRLLATSGPTLTAHKLAAIVSYTREQAASSNIEAFVRADISDAGRLSLDATLFGSQPDDGITPGGLLNGVTPIGAAGRVGPVADPAVEDVGKLVAALVTANGGLNATLIMNPAQATRLKFVAGPKFDTPILQSNSVADGTLIAVESSSFVSAFDAVPEFQ